jgi:uncharacterized membrane protein HdeD (DUF308 family)
MSSTQASDHAVADRPRHATHEAHPGTLEGRRAALALVAAAQFMSVLDASIITVALPSIQIDLKPQHVGALLARQRVRAHVRWLPAARRAARRSPRAAPGSRAGMGAVRSTDALGWEWVFFVNVPGTLAGAIAAPTLLPEAKLPRTSYDIAGGVTVTAGLALLVYALVQTESNGWGSPRTLSLLAGAALLLALFAAIEARVAHPLVRLGFLRNATVSYANATGALFGASVLVPLFFFSTLYLQRVLGYGPEAAGLAYLPMAVTSFGARPSHGGSCPGRAPGRC